MSAIGKIYLFAVGSSFYAGKVKIYAGILRNIAIRRFDVTPYSEIGVYTSL